MAELVVIGFPRERTAQPAFATATGPAANAAAGPAPQVGPTADLPPTTGRCRNA